MHFGHENWTNLCLTQHHHQCMECVSSHADCLQFLRCVTVIQTQCWNADQLLSYPLPWRCFLIQLLYEACRYLAARCHFAAKEHQQALDILDLEEPISKRLFGKCLKDESSLKDPSSDWEMSQSSIKSSICLLRGKIYDALDNRTLATYSYKEALKLDVYCFEAFDLLTSHHMLTAQEEKELLESLPLSKLCTEEQELLRFLFENKLKKYNKPSETVIPESVDGLQENLDVVVSLAERHYYNCDFKMCYKLTSVVMEKDPFHANCLPVHIGTLVELNKANELFYLSHKLVDLYPSNPVSWFAVGCYYLMVGHKNEHARRYLSKATTLEKTYGPAWIAYGHSFAVESEHDQAMAAYFTAAQLMKGCHLPMLYIGLEYGLTNNSKLAERFFGQALSIAPEDPFVMHEVGVVAFQNGEWKTAEKWFLDALEKIKAIGNEVTVDKWEPLLNNLGHVCRKLKKYAEALDYHRQALVLIPQNASTYSAIGYIHSLMGSFENAVDCFHTALGLRRDDTFSVTMLGHCIEMYIGDSEAYIGADIKDKLKCYDFDVHTMKTLKNIISPPWDFREFEVEKQTVEEAGLAPLETSRKTPDSRPSLEETFEIEMNESDMMLETPMSDHST
ncbi:cell division cycle protein 16 homolog isoform X3 [Globicephala melas]|uniref:cell division cycle protein 16 homolog isoform X3 n=2 Tax=Globicephala melas TaxID=9731 RepID=UPI00293D3C2B|nr:cell division cycle protein 16 homolog isoform X3 [Globicephala melas]XP_060143885.1 cell division cycle protein 16 homolog isoform X3 [Globicephala melas]